MKKDDYELKYWLTLMTGYILGCITTSLVFAIKEGLK